MIIQYEQNKKPLTAREGDFVYLKEVESEFFCKIAHKGGMSFSLVDLETGDLVIEDVELLDDMLQILVSRYDIVKVIPHESVTFTVAQ